jgi:uncharacterized protein (TIGR03083 family)
VTPQQHLDHIAAESAHFASATAGALEQKISHLTDWTVRDLVAHLGGVYSFVTANVADPSDERRRPGDEANAPAGDAINDWFTERRTTLLATLSSADPDLPTWTLAGLKTADWWKRRMAAETCVHRWDAEAGIKGIDAAAPIDDELATDAVNEYLEVFLRSSRRDDRVYPAESLHLHRSDGPGEWMLASDGKGGVAVTHEHGKGDAAVRGPASALLLWLWGRRTTEVEVFGDQAVAQAWQSLAP